MAKKKTRKQRRAGARKKALKYLLPRRDRHQSVSVEAAREALERAKQIHP